MTPLEKFLAALQTPAHRNGHGWAARCPAHEDQHASLSITTGDDDRVLLRCHAGCEAAAIVAAVGLQMRDLFPARETPLERDLTYDYVDERGERLFQVVRFATRDGKKDFRQRRPDGSGGWIWKLDGVRRVLYHLPDLTGKEAIFVVEGEKDADRLRSIGLPATTNAGGAGKWRDEYPRALRPPVCSEWRSWLTMTRRARRTHERSASPAMRPACSPR